MANESLRQARAAKNSSEHTLATFYASIQTNV